MKLHDFDCFIIVNCKITKSPSKIVPPTAGYSDKKKNGVLLKSELKLHLPSKS